MHIKVVLNMLKSLFSAVTRQTVYKHHLLSESEVELSLSPSAVCFIQMFYVA